MLFIKNVTIKEALLFLLFAGMILAAKWTVNLLVKKRKWKSIQKDRIMQGITSLVNWAAFYGIIILFLLYFSREQWLFYTLFIAGEVEVTLYLIIVAFLTVSLANQLVKVFTKYVLTSVYEFYGVDRGLDYKRDRTCFSTFDAK
ncbi:hypothetical protein [Sporosarcina globispora]|uniref:hypothetical protein n=1 Tax=Sporosarcina globispora TaxID=1459 RepID=UPI000AA39457|nr:hypothetical protein [Sporosarcina globispora]